MRRGTRRDRERAACSPLLHPRGSTLCNMQRLHTLIHVCPLYMQTKNKDTCPVPLPFGLPHPLLGLPAWLGTTCQSQPALPPHTRIALFGIPVPPTALGDVEEHAASRLLHQGRVWSVPELQKVLPVLNPSLVHAPAPTELSPLKNDLSSGSCCAAPRVPAAASLGSPLLDLHSVAAGDDAHVHHVQEQPMVHHPLQRQDGLRGCGTAQRSAAR